MTTGNKATGVAYAMAAVVAIAIARDLTRIPLPLYDCFGYLLDLQQSPSVWATMVSSLNSYGYMRPLSAGAAKLLFDLAHGHYLLVYEAFHALLVIAFFALFVRALQVRTRRDVVAAALALTVFSGIHTFLGTVKEVYPINHYLVVSVLCLTGLNLAQSRGRWTVDIAACLVFVLAALTLESGVLVWVVITAAWIAGFRGISTRGVVVVTALFAAYLVVRFGYLANGLPSLTERSSGYLLTRLDALEINARFAGARYKWYAYNVASSAASVLFSQPRAGLWVIAREWIRGMLQPRTCINLAASLFATGLIGWFVVDRLKSGVRWPETSTERHILIFVATLAANCALCYSYTKDEILTTAGALYAVAAYGAVRHLLDRVDAQPRLRLRTAALGVLLLTGSIAWSIRAVGVHHGLMEQGFRHRNDWARLPLIRDAGMRPRTAEGLELARALREQALTMRQVNPRLVPRWAGRIFDADY